MKPLWTASEVAEATGGTLASVDFDIHGVSIDSRSVQPGDLFIALKGPTFDGHAYADQALAAGAAGCLVSVPRAGPCILATDTQAALTRLGRAARDRYAGDLVGITGSVGKTTTRALGIASFGALGKAYGTTGNLNNHLGVPLTLANMPRDTDYAIIEMGMNHFGEIAHLSNMARPTTALITAIDWVHSENLDGTLQGVARAKGEIVAGLSGPLIAPQPLQGLLGFLEDVADVRWVEAPFDGNLALPGIENRWNAALILAALPRVTARSLAALAAQKPQRGRGQPLGLGIGARDITVYDDAYNAAPASMRAAIRNLVASGPGRKIAVVGSMAELANPLMLHENLGKFLAEQPLDMVVAVGKFKASILAPLPPSILAVGFDHPSEVTPHLLPRLQSGDQVLVKASNSTGLASVVADLVAAQDTWQN